ncbi:uncharacterized protein UDID_17685 [Ustilago sp. UG-2017a]|nr:uncharacterized protein UDID_17685 [Ustilago sp. UG-2017a]
MDDLLTKLHNLEGPWNATLQSGSQYNSRNDPVPPPLTSSTTYSAPTQLISTHVVQAKLKLARAYRYTTICPEPFNVDHDKYISSLGTLFGLSSSKNNVTPDSTIHNIHDSTCCPLIYQGGTGPQCPETKPVTKRSLPDPPQLTSLKRMQLAQAKCKRSRA